jgi:hypothetical protein
VSKNLETSTPVSPEEIVWRTEDSVQLRAYMPLHAL